MIPVVCTPLTSGYKKYSYPLSVNIHFQYLFPIRCRFCPYILVDTDFFDIPSGQILKPFIVGNKFYSEISFKNPNIIL